MPAGIAGLCRSLPAIGIWRRSAGAQATPDARRRNAAHRCWRAPAPRIPDDARGLRRERHWSLRHRPSGVAALRPTCDERRFPVGGGTGRQWPPARVARLPGFAEPGTAPCRTPLTVRTRPPRRPHPAAAIAAGGRVSTLSGRLP